MTFRDYYTDPRSHLRARIDNAKWLFGNIQTDQTSVDVFPDFQNFREAGSLGCEVSYSDDVPWVSGAWLNTDDDPERLKDIDYLNTGLNVEVREYADALREMAEEFPVRFEGGPILYPARDAPFPYLWSDGPFTLACEVRGATPTLEDVILRPDFLHRLMRIVTDKILEGIEYGRTYYAAEGMGGFLGEDFAQNLSAQHFKEFIVPYCTEILDAMPGMRMFHMCGRINHLLETISENLPIQYFHGLGSSVDRDHACECIASKMTVSGGVDPILLYEGTPDDIRRDACDAIEKLSRYGSFILQDGSNIPPGTPIENINAMYEAAKTG